MTTRWGGGLQAGATFVAGLLGERLGRWWAPASPYGWLDPYFGVVFAAVAATLAYAALWDIANPSRERSHAPEPDRRPPPSSH